jgi:hypothetical protein
VRPQWLLQISGRAGENESGKWRGGGVGSVPHGGREMGERERGPHVQQSAAWGEGRGQQWPPVIKRVWRCCCANRGEQRDVGDATDLRDRVVSRPSGSGRGTQEREERGSVVMGR